MGKFTDRTGVGPGIQARGGAGGESGEGKYTLQTELESILDSRETETWDRRSRGPEACGVQEAEIPPKARSSDARRLDPGGNSRRGKKEKKV